MIPVEKCFFLDLEYCYPSASKKSEWRYHKAKLRIMTLKVGKGPTRVVDVWKESDIWDEVFDLLAQGYILVSHNVIADVRPDLCDERILPYLLKGQIWDTLYVEKLINGMTDPVGDWSNEGASVDEEFEEDENIDNEHKDFSKVFALDSLIYRHTGIVVKKLYQDARNYLRLDLPEAVLQYCKEDIKYMHRIYENQAKKVEELDLQYIVDMNHKLIATSYIIMKYGVAIDIDRLTTDRREYKLKAANLEEKLMHVLPKVPYSDTQLIDLFFKMYWVKGGLAGFTSKTKAIEAVKKNQNHSLVTRVRDWIEANREKFLHPVNLSAPAQKLESFKRMEIRLPDTAEKTVKNYLMDNDSLALESYLSWQRCNSLLKKVLEKFDYGMYLRPDNTIRSTFYWVNALNGRSTCSEANVQQIPRDLKSIFGKPLGMVSISFDYAAIEFYKLLNDYPEQELLNIMLSDNDDIHIYNAAKFFDRKYDELLALHKAKDKDTKNLRNASKTVIYFLQYKTPKNPDEHFVTGTAKLMEIFRTDLGWDLSKEMAEKLIIQGEAILRSWTKEKLAIDADVLSMANGKSNLKSKLLRHLRQNPEDMKRALEDGVIFFRGAKNMYYKFDMGRDYIYTPEEQVWDAKEERYKTKREYVNSRSLYSCAVAGPVAIGAKHAVMDIQKELYEKYGPDNARLNLFVHDSVTVYCKPELAEEVKEIVIRNLLHTMYDIGGFRALPTKIEGGIDGQPDEIYSYNGVEIEKL
jgi:hypothetical protein